MRITIALGLALSAALLAVPGSAHAATTSACQAATTAHSQTRCNRVQVVGHRAWESWPAPGTNENTLAALKKDYLTGVGCETDTWRLASDAGVRSGGPSVMFHDTTIGRVVSAASLAATGLTADTAIADVTLAKFRLLRTKGGQPLPTLYQWLKNEGTWQVPCKIEVKQRPLDPAQAKRWATTFNAPATFYGNPQDPTGPAPCSQAGVLAMKAAGFAIGMKYRFDCPESMAAMAAAGYSYLTYAHPTAAVVADAHAHGLAIGDGGNTATDWTNQVNIGLDFIVTNYPARTKTWLRGS